MSDGRSAHGGPERKHPYKGCWSKADQIAAVLDEPVEDVLKVSGDTDYVEHLQTLPLAELFTEAMRQIGRLSNAESSTDWEGKTGRRRAILCYDEWCQRGRPSA